MSRNKRNTINEEIDRIKNIITINEQCGSDTDQCVEDLKGQGYAVSSPAERSESCSENDGIKCIMELVNSLNINTSNYKIDSGKGKGNCFVLLLGKNKTDGGYVRTYVTLYSDYEIVLTMRLGTINESRKLVYSGTFNCENGNIDKLRYRGIFVGSNVVSDGGKIIKRNDGNGDVMVTADESTNTGIPEGALKYENYLHWRFDKSSHDTYTVREIKRNLLS